jgi:hypothetical protein
LAICLLFLFPVRGRLLFGIEEAVHSYALAPDEGLLSFDGGCPGNCREPVRRIFNPIAKRFEGTRLCLRALGKRLR